jgi:hypothetical protein
MGALDHPAPGLVPCFLLERLRCCPTCPDVCREATVGPQLTDFVVVIALVQTHPLRLLTSRLRPRHGYARAGRVSHLDVMAIGPRSGKADRPAAVVGAQAAFGAALPPSGGVLADLVPPRGGPWSWPPPWPATARRSPGARRTRPDRVATAPGPRPRPPILGSGDARRSWNKDPWYAEHASDIRGAAQQRWQPSPAGRRLEGDGCPRGAVAATGAAGGSVPITRQESAHHAGLAREDQTSMRLLWE